jgi:hypothetical protein
MKQTRNSVRFTGGMKLLEGRNKLSEISFVKSVIRVMEIRKM